MSIINVSIVDDHVMISNAISKMIEESPDFKVLNTSENGKEFIEKVENLEEYPQIVLMDVNMPIMNGLQTTQWLTENYPEIKVIALTMEDEERTIIQMLKSGAKGYLLKDMHPDILFEALHTVAQKGIFYTDIITQSLYKLHQIPQTIDELKNDLKLRELEFIQHACSEMTYKEIAEKMFLSPKTIDNYRDSVFVKLNVKSRVGLVMYAIKHDLYENQ